MCGDAVTGDLAAPQDYGSFLTGHRTFKPLGESQLPQLLWNQTACNKLDAFFFVHNACNNTVAINYTVMLSSCGGCSPPTACVH